MTSNPLFPRNPSRKHHLAYVDAYAWPGIVEIPHGFLSGLRTRRAELEFAAACEKAGLVLQGADADLEVVHEELFARIAYAGWLGLAEGFMAGEWVTEDLVSVLVKLLQVGYRPRFAQADIGGPYAGAEVPMNLVQHYSGDGMSVHGTVFSSGVPTTERTSVKSFVPGAGRGFEPGSHFVDVTELSDPTWVERADLADAQLRSVTMLLDLAQVGVGTHVLDFPSSGPALPIAAASRHATVDVLSADVDHVRAVRRILDLTDVDSSVHVEPIDDPFPSPRAWPVHYDAITSVEKLEHMGARGQREYVKFLDQMLASGGYIAVQTVVAAAGMSSSADQSLDVVRAYVSPALRFESIEGLHKLFDAHTGLRIIAQTHVGGHYVHGLRMQRETFEGKLREAAADGYDLVYRRLWLFQLALKEALFMVGALDAVQLKVTARLRHRRR